MARNAATSTVTWTKARLPAEGMYRERVPEGSPPFRFTRRNSRREGTTCVSVSECSKAVLVPRMMCIQTTDASTRNRLKENASKHAHTHIQTGTSQVQESQESRQREQLLPPAES